MKTYSNNLNMECVSKCPTFPNYLFADDSTASCSSNCQLGYYKNTIDQTCIKNCPNLLYLKENTCV